MTDITYKKERIIVIGGGASGLFAAYGALLANKDVFLLEKNEKLGKKIYITGKGRCNLSNYILPQEFINNVVVNQKFLMGAINVFSPYDTYSFFENNGLSLKVERGNRVFPTSDKASDVTKTLEKTILSMGATIRLNTEVKNILFENGKILGVLLSSGEKLYSDSVIVCTGGKSYPATGSTGDGYAFAKNVGHTIIPLKPALVGLELLGEDYQEMQGLTLKNVRLSALCNDKMLFSDFGEMLFTHFGISGPIVLSCSSNINRIDGKIKISIDLKPALDEKTLDLRLIRELSDNNGKEIASVIRSLVPSSMVKIILKRSSVKYNKKCAEIAKEERSRIIKVLKNFEFTVKNLRPIEEAVVTSGGINVKEINPKTMESKLVKGLYFAGEVLDVDAYTGGFNMQIAFSTGFIAGKNA